MRTALLRRYGATPLHLIAHVTAFSIASYALAQIVRSGAVESFVIWFVGAALLHDLVFVPVYSMLDRVAARVATRGVHPSRLWPDVPVINHLRAPAVISGTLLLVYFPLILGLDDHKYFAATGRHVDGYTRNWLLITAALFAGSALVYALRLRARLNQAPS